MTDVVLEDAQGDVVVAARLGDDVLDGVADGVDAPCAPGGVPGQRAGERRDGRPQGPAGRGVQDPVGVAGVAPSDDGGEGGVAVPLGAGLVEHAGAAVEGHQVALAEHPLPRDAVHDLLVDRDAHGGRVVVVALEVGAGAGALDRGRAHGVELPGGHPRAHRLPQGRMDVGDDEARAPHEAHLVGRLDLNAVAQQPHTSSCVW